MLLALSPFLLAELLCGMPYLKRQPELIADGEIKACVLNGRYCPPATPVGDIYASVDNNGNRTEVKLFSPADIWRQRAHAGEWRDGSGNVMRLARVLSLIPAFDDLEVEKSAIEARLDEMEKAFQNPTEEDFATWRQSWGTKGLGRLFTAKNGKHYYVEFETKNRQDADRLMGDFFESMKNANVFQRGISSAKWQKIENADYVFYIDFSDEKGKRFVQELMDYLVVLRRCFEFYIPPQRQMRPCTVRIFKKHADFYAYCKDQLYDGEEEDDSFIGYWVPSMEELLISAEDQKQALRTFRHEAFHQYLALSTANSNHATWFNEGHAKFFENSEHDKRHGVKICEDKNAMSWLPKIDRKLFFSVLGTEHGDFYDSEKKRLRNRQREVWLRYATSWAIVYFLEKGPLVDKRFAAYGDVIPKYLALTAAGESPLIATEKAWKEVEGKDVYGDFRKFWNNYRQKALKTQPHAQSPFERNGRK